MANPVLVEYASLLEEVDRRDRRNLMAHVFPDQTHEWRGQTYHGRDRYQSQLEFLDATARYSEVAMMASNRSGKTIVGSYAMTVWLTGLYPAWWSGKRFDGPTQCWAAGTTNETVRDIIQGKLFGRVTQEDGRKTVTGTGMIPGDKIGSMTWRNGFPNLIDTVQIRHVSGEWSELGLKSYEQGRESFEGTSKHVVWMDEEPPLDVATECLTRTATTNGVMIYTFTPLRGLSEVALRFVPGGKPDVG